MADHRRCEKCGGAMPKRTHRQRNQKGNLVCDSCSDSLSPTWGSYAPLTDPERQEMQRREAEAVSSVMRVSRMQRTAASGYVIVDRSGEGKQGHYDAVYMMTPHRKVKGYHRPQWTDDPKQAFVFANRETAEKWKDKVSQDHTVIEEVPSTTASLQTIAHDSGDGALINHCPFCGSGSVTGRSDGGVECDFCNNVFTVQVQPPHPNMPQTVNGQPVTPPGMPGGEPKEISGTDDPSVHESEEGVAANPLNDDDPTKPKNPNPFAKAAPPAKGAPPAPGAKPAPQGAPQGGDKKKSLPPWMKNKKSFRTSTGATLEPEDYMAHLALAYADDRDAVLDTVRVANVQREAAHPDFPHGVPYECSKCGNYRNSNSCPVCDDRAENSGIRNPGPLDYLFHRLFPSGATATQHEAVGEIQCPACRGTGVDPHDEDGEDCHLCNGEGNVMWNQVEEWRDRLDQAWEDGSSAAGSDLHDLNRRYPIQGGA